MGNPPIEIEYNHGLKPLEALLAKVNRPGDFYASGSLVTVLPHLEIKGVGPIAFPLLEMQARAIAAQAERAPYGKGEETLIDTKLRKVWQIPPARVRLGGAAWKTTLDTILSNVAEGLGCKAAKVEAELYKLLLYDPGAFFVAHRDTEKAEGMFGTLVIVLPSLHRGGKLIVRHAGRKVSLDLTTPEPSQLAYAAFYADCEHEVLPVTKGNRLCLIYNLIQKHGGRKAPAHLLAPDYAKQIPAVEKVLADFFRDPNGPPKIAWLLEHQYSPASLSFSGLKNADAAIGKVLAAAAKHAGCAVHLGIVHIEESGSAEPTYLSRRSSYGWNRFDEDDDHDEDASDAEFEIIDFEDDARYIANWVGPDDRAVDFGEIPLEQGELLPAGKLDGEKPDTQRLMEATGNEGASFERSYHRAVIVIWAELRAAEVLLQAGPAAVLPYLRERVAEAACEANPQHETAAWQEVTALANLMLGKWEARVQPQGSYGRSIGDGGKRAQMLRLLAKIGKPDFLRRFIANVVVPEYEGTENPALATSVPLLDAITAGELLSLLIEKNMPRSKSACVDLVARLGKLLTRKVPAGLATAVRRAAAAAVDGLAVLDHHGSRCADYDWVTRQFKPADEHLVTNLLEALRLLGDPALIEAAGAKLCANPAIYTPDEVLAPALSLLAKRSAVWATQIPYLKLWRHCATFLLDRSEHAPKEPRDWAQPALLDCTCAQCRELAAFAADAGQQIHRFRLREDLRKHLESVAIRNQLNLACTTERTGSPQTLVCTKTRKTYQRRCEQYAEDLDRLMRLAALGKKLPKDAQALRDRMELALRRG